MCLSNIFSLCSCSLLIFTAAHAFSPCWPLVLFVIFSPPPSVAFGMPYLLIELFYIGMSVVRSVGLNTVT